MRRLLEKVETRYDENDKPFHRRITGLAAVNNPIREVGELYPLLPKLENGWKRVFLNFHYTPVVDSPQDRLEYEFADERVDETDSYSVTATRP